MMAQNNKLKRQAQKFAATYSVPYLTALHAVDEPLHELRDLTRQPEALGYITTRAHFRLVGTEGIYSPAFEELPLFDTTAFHFNYIGFMREQNLHRFSDAKASLRELGRRLMLIEGAGANDIWGYRELHRAGLLGGSAPALEPIFHHYFRGLFEDQSNLTSEGPELGIFTVAISPLHELIGPFCYPVTRDQLQRLSSGETAGEIWSPLYDPTSRSSEFRRWTESYSRSYNSLPERWGWNGARDFGGIRVFLKAIPEDETAAFEALGLKREHFEREEHLESVEISFLLNKDRISGHIERREVLAGSSQNLIFV